MLDCWFESRALCRLRSSIIPLRMWINSNRTIRGTTLLSMWARSCLVLLCTCGERWSFGHNAFKHVNVTGTLAGNDGRKMSKLYGNYTDPDRAHE